LIVSRGVKDPWVNQFAEPRWAAVGAVCFLGIEAQQNMVAAAVTIWRLDADHPAAEVGAPP
jgi:hypothetical protein